MKLSLRFEGWRKTPWGKRLSWRAGLQKVLFPQAACFSAHDRFLSSETAMELDLL